ncbi:uncharacterized protein LOC113147604, partial [Cyclospora cayetanensis]|uniref:Uncharacterized protein LOC113147604 n=1 Tax=Cyclospora cayetanensis TaxID=88456 RepID=A0A6P6S2U8_9EIME
QQATAAAASGLPLIFQRYVLQQTRLRLHQQQQQRQQQQGAAARNATASRQPLVAGKSAFSSSSSSSSSGSSFLTARENTILDLGPTNFVAVVFMEGRGFSVAGADINPMAVDVFSGAFPASADGEPTAESAAAATAAFATRMGALTVKIERNFASGRCLLWNTLGDYRPARATLRWENTEADTS